MTMPRRHEEQPFAQVAEFLHRWINSHPALEGLPGRVQLHASEEAVCIRYRKESVDLHQKVARPKWWLPRNRRGAARLLAELAIGLREQYDTLPEDVRQWRDVATCWTDGERWEDKFFPGARQTFVELTIGWTIAEPPDAGITHRETGRKLSIGEALQEGIALPA